MNFIARIKNVDVTKKRLIENIIANGSLQAVNYLLPLITLPYLTRVLGVTNFGLVNFANAFISYFIALVDFGFGLSAAREISINRNDKKIISEIFNSVIILKLALIIVSYFIINMMALYVPKVQENFLLFNFTFLMVLGNAIFPVWFFQGIERMKYVTFLNILAKLLFAILLFTVIKKSSDYIYVPLLISLGYVISGLIGLYVSVRRFNVKLFFPNISILWKQLKYSAVFFLSTASYVIKSSTNTFTLGLVSTNTSVGYYSAADKINVSIGQICAPLSVALYPYMAKYKNIRLFKKLFFSSFVFGVVLFLAIFIFAKQITTVVLGNEMMLSYKILQIFSFAFIITAPASLINYPFLGALGYVKHINLLQVASTIIYLLILITLFIFNLVNLYTLAVSMVIVAYIPFSVNLYWSFKYDLWNEDNPIYQ